MDAFYKMATFDSLHTCAMIRDVTLNDLDEIMTVENSAFKTGIAESKATFRSRIEKFPEGFIVAEMDDRVIAYLCSEIWDSKKSCCEYDFSLNAAIDIKHRDDGSVFYISSMAVLPEYRGNRYATALFEKALEIAKRKNCRRTILIVCKEWENAIRIYARHDFKSVSIKKGFFRPDGEKAVDGIVMAREMI